MQTVDNKPCATSPPQLQSACIVCGPDHPHGLRIGFELASDGSIGAHWTPTEDWEGYRGIIHGGIVSAVLDDAMAKAVATVGAALTGELRVRFRHPVTPGEDLRIRGWIVEHNAADNQGRSDAHYGRRPRTCSRLVYVSTARRKGEAIAT